MFTKKLMIALFLFGLAVALVDSAHPKFMSKSESESKAWRLTSGTLKRVTNEGDPMYDIVDEPMKLLDAEHKNWTRIGDGCEGDNGIFPGIRMFDGKDTVHIYTNHKFIAGTQSLLKKSDYSENGLPNVQFYVEEEINGEMYYVATVYFIDPSIICSQDHRQRAAKTLLFQKGNNQSDLVSVLPNADTEKMIKIGWIEFPCSRNYGIYYVAFDYSRSICSTLIPIEPMYETTGDKKLRGFNWFHFTNGNNEAWFQLTKEIINGDLEDVDQTLPPCLTELYSSGFTLSAKPFYFSEPILECVEQL